MAIRAIRKKHNSPRSKKSSGAGARQTFDVLVLATMSAGKSSFINALVGRSLLPAANEATTACLTSIEHRRTAKSFRGTCYSDAGDKIITEPDASTEAVRAWNADTQIRRIHLSGKFRTHLPLGPGLVLHDTPGPNNSQDERHGELMLDAIHRVPFKLLCYVLNAAQLGTWDDRRLLEQLRELLAQQPQRPLVFILNKVDLLDPERGEDLAGSVSKARRYLEGLGFLDAIIVPTMANIALYARKAMHAEPLTRVERIKLRQALDELGFEQENTLQAAAMPEALKARVLRELKKSTRPGPLPSDDVQAGDVAELEQLLVHSGIRTVEFLLNQRSTAA
ncbi:dynamin family protein [Massilia sp. LXY-6]|uniref:dynamin family protein n=1 Tax=Massilia sp. LXY-6 TaxID=3379823 RepID=UPI003EE04372